MRVEIEMRVYLTTIALKCVVFLLHEVVEYSFNLDGIMMILDKYTYLRVVALEDFNNQTFSSS